MNTQKSGRGDIGKYFFSDESFNQLLPDHLREVAAKHWTPVDVAIKAAKFLDTHTGVRILDIGSGAGKFCFIAAYYHPDTHFTGVEQRVELIAFCNELKNRLGLSNIEFVHGNIKDFDISLYDHFYFYNSFYENIPGTQKIDYKVSYSESLYNYYNLVLYKKLNKTPVGTRLVTYHSLGQEVPQGFEVLKTDYNEFLKFWQKI